MEHELEMVGYVNGLGLSCLNEMKALRFGSHGCGWQDKALSATTEIGLLSMLCLDATVIPLF